MVGVGQKYTSGNSGAARVPTWEGGRNVRWPRWGARGGEAPRSFNRGTWRRLRPFVLWPTLVKGDRIVESVLLCRHLDVPFLTLNYCNRQLNKKNSEKIYLSKNQCYHQQVHISIQGVYKLMWKCFLHSRLRVVLQNLHAELTLWYL